MSESQESHQGGDHCKIPPGTHVDIGHGGGNGKAMAGLEADALAQGKAD